MFAQNAAKDVLVSIAGSLIVASLFLGAALSGAPIA